MNSQPRVFEAPRAHPHGRPPRRAGTAALLALAVGLLAACGGGGGGSDEDSAPPVTPVPVPPVQPPVTPPSDGLGGKPALKGLTFPQEAASSGDLRVTKAFPSLSFEAPVVFAIAPGNEGRAYVATQGGRILTFDKASATPSTSVFLDLTDRTRANGEQGLLGMAFDPGFASNRFVYVYFSKNAAPNVDAGNATVQRFTVSADGLTADRGSVLQLLSEPDRFNNHNGGSLAFGPDGLLYLALGDGGSGGDPDNNAQNLGNVLGKILRLKPTGGVPADNPFVGRAGARGEIWAYGLRNPFRMSFDRATGALWAGDVGQNQYEEIDLVTRGGNYGWRLREGRHDFNTSDPRATVPLVEPVFEYSHSEGCSITGGVVYRGAAIPKLAGQYLYSDFCSGTLWGLVQNAAGAWMNTVLGSVPNPSGFWEDAAGEVFVTSYDGSVYKLEAAGTGASTFPRLLSQTGLFTDTAALTPNPGLIDYTLNAPFWSDSATKRRWFGIPENAKVTFSPDVAYDLPPGSATVKHFEVTLADGRTRRLETRVFLRGNTGWNGYTYKWNAAGTDAELLDGALRETLTVRTETGAVRTFDYEYPSRAACLSCHTAAAGVPLGVRTAQLNRAHTFASTGVTDNQLRAYNTVALFDRDIGAASSYAVQPTPTDTAQSLAARARSYLDTNCGQCHRPGGPTGSNMDLRYTTPIAVTNTVNVAPNGGDLGIAGAARIVPGAKERSLVWERMRRLDSARMPPVGSHLVDEAGLALVGQWIDAGASD